MIVKASQVVVGIIFNVLAYGLAAYSFRALMGDVPKIISAPMLPEIKVPVLSEIPIIGKMVFEQSVMLYITLVLAVIAGLILFKTRFGLNLRAVGENPKSAASAGTDVVRMRIIGVLISGFGGGLAGAYFVLVQIGVFRETIVQGRGFIALGIVILARWNPYLAVFNGFFVC